jgi:endonuclease/exonuclease/phosphatase (EEP) superfamily protein YafD
MGARRWIAGIVAAPWVAWAVVRAFGLDLFWPVVALVSLTPYAAATAVVPLVLSLVLRQRLVAAVALVALVALAAAVAPRAVGDPAPAGGREITVMSANLFGGRGDARAVLRLARRHDVDVLSLQELSPEAVARLDAAGASELFPGRAVEARPGGAGSGVLARHPTTAVDGDSNDLPAQPAADVALPRAPVVRVKAIHPFPPLTRDNSQRWRTELRELPDADADGTGSLRILAGDFNATLDHRELRRLLDRGWTDAADAVGQGLHPTWPVGRRAPPITIDHVLVGPGIGVRAFSVHDVPGSDHRAVIARLALPSG